jgi:hypothetical protein
VAVGEQGVVGRERGAEVRKSGDMDLFRQRPIERVLRGACETQTKLPPRMSRERRVTMQTQNWRKTRPGRPPTSATLITKDLRRETSSLESAASFPRGTDGR